MANIFYQSVVKELSGYLGEKADGVLSRQLKHCNKTEDNFESAKDQKKREKRIVKKEQAKLRSRMVADKIPIKNMNSATADTYIFSTIIKS